MDAKASVARKMTGMPWPLKPAAMNLLPDLLLLIPSLLNRFDGAVVVDGVGGEDRGGDGGKLSTSTLGTTPI